MPDILQLTRFGSPEVRCYGRAITTPTRAGYGDKPDRQRAAR